MDLTQVARIKEAYDVASVSRVVAPGDDMWSGGQDWYFSVGESGLDVVLRALSLARTQKVRRILDLPCGYGRVARHLRAAFPNAEMAFCDIDETGVAFCADQFGGQDILSKPELTDVELPSRLDVIWIGSLFTHVDEERTARWLAYLAQHLVDGGVLVATFHGMWSIHVQRQSPMIDSESWETILAGYRERGFGYARYRDMDLGDFGLSLARPSRIIDIATSIPDVRVLMYQERGWADNHDVLALTNERPDPWVREESADPRER